MKNFRKKIEAKLLTYSGLKEIIQKNGVTTIIDFAISCLLNLISRRFYGFANSTDYGLSEAFFHSRDIDRWSRYIYVVNEIRKIKGKELSVLEVGSGGQGISGFLSPLKKSYDFFLLDVRKDALKVLRRVNCVIGDGCSLPLLPLLILFNLI